MSLLKDVFKAGRLFGHNPVTLILRWLWEGVKEFYALANFTTGKKLFAAGIITCLIGISYEWPAALWLLALAPVAFIQNMFFTLVSRSRNSQDTDYHRYCAWGSNGVWFVCQVMIVKNIWTAIHAGNYWYAIAAGVVYSLATTEGSVLMMKRLIKSEKGKRRVGANDKIDALEKRIADLESRHKAPGIVKPLILGMTGPPADAISDIEVDTPNLSKCAMTSDDEKPEKGS